MPNVSDGVNCSTSSWFERSWGMRRRSSNSSKSDQSFGHFCLEITPLGRISVFEQEGCIGYKQSNGSGRGFGHFFLNERVKIIKTYLTIRSATCVLTNVYGGFVFIKNLARADVQIWPSLLKSRNEDAMSPQGGRFARRNRRGRGGQGQPLPSK
jgi:hypothetical protein